MTLFTGKETLLLTFTLIGSLFAVVVAIVVLAYLGQTPSADAAHEKERQFIRFAMGIQLAIFALLALGTGFFLVEHARNGQRGRRVLAALRTVRGK